MAGRIVVRPALVSVPCSPSALLDSCHPLDRARNGHAHALEAANPSARIRPVYLVALGWRCRLQRGSFRASSGSWAVGPPDRARWRPVRSSALSRHIGRGVLPEKIDISKIWI
jgi:hypothetical protein